MKKKKKDTKKADMPEFEFKEFTPEEDAVYHEAVEKFRAAVDSGRTLQQAYDSFPIADKSLETIIRADFLKIMIAELHFGKGMTIDDLAGKFGVGTTLIQDTMKRMLQEAGVSAANQFGQEFGSLEQPTND
ncbi:MAG: hypothetical protein A2X56_12525 [Nitrospirae bacterium GWC2_57_13]|jgi:hypothetical protein|nr:MAG: hypothetical protein A2X56_12525 [Nitrospirae bacterium GWC2_57_13]OGW43568.1 MAG: hypothetical protein A2X57_11390 [Nitrospirae bacterium GWD2_57_8]